MERISGSLDEKRRQWITASEVVEEFPTFRSARAVIHAVKRGLLPAYRIGQRMMFDRDEVERVVREGKVTP